MLVIRNGKAYDITTFEGYSRMLYLSEEYELASVMDSLVQEHEDEISMMESTIDDLELQSDDAYQKLVGVYNLSEDFIEYIKTAKRLDRDVIIRRLKEILRETDV